MLCYRHSVVAVVDHFFIALAQYIHKNVRLIGAVDNIELTAVDKIQQLRVTPNGKFLAERTGALIRWGPAICAIGQYAPVL